MEEVHNKKDKKGFDTNPYFGIFLNDVSSIVVS